ncbi:hypothetical protein [Fretibacter rubidus]|uniref:hypothetical protein n=1 Tax=Fretibacter rubidus TaxID=570162 RepID=UPI00352AEB9E
MTKKADKINAAKRNAKRVVFISLIFVIPASIYFIFFDFSDDNVITRHGYIAHTIGVILAFLSAFLFMGITFFSSRGGYDDQPNYREIVEKHRAEEKAKSRGGKAGEG